MVWEGFRRGLGEVNECTALKKSLQVKRKGFVFGGVKASLTMFRLVLRNQKNLNGWSDFKSL